MSFFFSLSKIISVCAGISVDCFQKHVTSHQASSFKGDHNPVKGYHFSKCPGVPISPTLCFLMVVQQDNEMCDTIGEGRVEFRSVLVCPSFFSMKELLNSVVCIRRCIIPHSPVTLLKNS